MPEPIRRPISFLGPWNADSVRERVAEAAHAIRSANVGRNHPLARWTNWPLIAVDLQQRVRARGLQAQVAVVERDLAVAAASDRVGSARRFRHRRGQGATAAGLSRVSLRASSSRRWAWVGPSGSWVPLAVSSGGRAFDRAAARLCYIGYDHRLALQIEIHAELVQVVDHCGMAVIMPFCFFWMHRILSNIRKTPMDVLGNRPNFRSVCVGNHHNFNGVSAVYQYRAKQIPY